MDPFAEAMKVLAFLLGVGAGIWVGNVMLGLLGYRWSGPLRLSPKAKHDEKPKRSEDSFELGDDGELIDTFEPGAIKLDDLICQYDRRED